MATAEIPILVKHCALAIYRDGYVKGTRLQRILHSFNIARGRLVEYGFLHKGSEEGDSSTIQLTAKGRRRESHHRRESGGQQKTKEWDALYALVEAGLEEDEGEGDMTAEATATATVPRESRPHQRRRRLAKATRRAPRPRVRKARRSGRG